MPRWFAYTSNESGRSEVYVRSFAGVSPVAGGKWQISSNGGTEPMWRGDGKELFFANGNKLMAIDVNPDGESFEKGIAKELFEAPLAQERRNNYAVSADGKRFLMNVRVEGKNIGQFTVMLNWRAGLNK